MVIDSTWAGPKQCKDIVGLLVPRLKKSDPNVKLKSLKIINVQFKMFFKYSTLL